ncbi:MAG: hypothetical protein QOK90_09610, partial [Nitrososphaeraceae archaeon]|nr:hypothetical protein [Nitrososphaeraceae archaeon]
TLRNRFQASIYEQVQLQSTKNNVYSNIDNAFDVFLKLRPKKYRYKYIITIMGVLFLSNLIAID